MRENVRNGWIMWPLMQLNKSVVIINATLQLLEIYKLVVDPCKMWEHIINLRYDIMYNLFFKFYCR